MARPCPGIAVEVITKNKICFCKTPSSCRYGALAHLELGGSGLGGGKAQRRVSGAHSAADLAR